VQAQVLGDLGPPQTPQPSRTFQYEFGLTIGYVRYDALDCRRTTLHVLYEFRCSLHPDSDEVVCVAIRVCARRPVGDGLVQRDNPKPPLRGRHDRLQSGLGILSKPNEHVRHERRRIARWLPDVAARTVQGRVWGEPFPNEIPRSDDFCYGDTERRGNLAPMAFGQRVEMVGNDCGRNPLSG
jgi:hypothetical protein